MSDLPMVDLLKTGVYSPYGNRAFQLRSPTFSTLEKLPQISKSPDLFLTEKEKKDNFKAKLKKRRS